VAKTLWVVVDGGYTKAAFLKPVLKASVVVIGRLLKDAALRTVPKPVPPSTPTWLATEIRCRAHQSI
jgi:hypothetical protein